MSRYHSKLIADHEWLVDWYLRGTRRDEDARQCGLLGLCEAALRFKPELGFAFSTYASFWVRREVYRYRDHRSKWSNLALVENISVEGSETQQPAVDLMIDIKKVLPTKVWVVFRMKYGRGMSDTEIAGVMRCSRQWVNSLVQIGLKEIRILAK
jgi:RNA polymerase sigma factor (sigma-70 family)